MESTVYSTPPQERPYVAIPFEGGIGGYLRIKGDEGVMQDIYEQYRQQERQEHGTAELGKRALHGVASVIGNVASNIALEARIAVFDSLHGTNYRQARADLIERQRRERFLASIGLVAVEK